MPSRRVSQSKLMHETEGDTLKDLLFNLLGTDTQTAVTVSHFLRGQGMGLMRPPLIVPG